MNKALLYFSDLHIALLLLNRLWNRYDSGGVSAGRGMQACLVETISRLRRPRYYYHEQLSEDDLLLEAEKRKSSSKNLQLEFNFDFNLSEISDEHLFKLILLRLHGWCVENLIINGNRINIQQWKLVEAAMSVLKVNDMLMTRSARLLNCTSEQLMAEGAERNWKRQNELCDGWV